MDKRRKNNVIRQVVVILLCVCLGAGTVSSIFAYDEESQAGGIAINEEDTGGLNASADGAEEAEPAGDQREVAPGQEAPGIEEPAGEQSNMPGETDTPDEADAPGSPAGGQAGGSGFMIPAVPDQDQEESLLPVSRSVVVADDGSLRLRYELWTDAEMESVSTEGIVAVFPDGQVWDPLLTDPDGLTGYFEILRDYDLWETYVGTALEMNPEEEMYTSAVVWSPVEDMTPPESFVYYTYVPEDILTAGQISPVIFLSGGTILPYDTEGEWENGELLIPSAEDAENGTLPEGWGLNVEMPPSEVADDLHVESSEGLEGDLHIDAETEDPGGSITAPEGEGQIDPLPEEPDGGEPDVEPGEEDVQPEESVEPLPDDEEPAPEYPGVAGTAPGGHGVTDVVPEDPGVSGTAPGGQGVTDAVPEDDGVASTVPDGQGVTDIVPEDHGTAGTAPESQGGIVKPDEDVVPDESGSLTVPGGSIVDPGEAEDHGPADAPVAPGNGNSLGEVPSEVIDSEDGEEQVPDIEGEPGDVFDDPETNPDDTAPEAGDAVYDPEDGGLAVGPAAGDAVEDPAPDDGVENLTNNTAEKFADITLFAPALQDENTVLTFTYSLTYPEMEEEVDLPAASGFFDLYPGEIATIDEVPDGTFYAIDLDPVEGYNLDQTSWVGLVEADEGPMIAPIARKYICGKEEHTHGPECYDETGTLICELEEHVHDESCLEPEQISANIILNAPAVQDVDAVFTFVYKFEYPAEALEDPELLPEEGKFKLKSGESMTLGPVPENTVYTVKIRSKDWVFNQSSWAGTVESSDDIEIVSDVPRRCICGKEEHTHSEECYDEEGNLICGMEEHVHDESCFEQDFMIDEPMEGPSIDPSLEEIAAETNKSYVQSLEITEIVDGTETFDGDDQPGNDSGDKNKIVRSFDSVRYTLNYTTALMDASQTVSEAYMMVEFTLPYSTGEVIFDDALLGWVEDKVITYHYSDGTVSTELDKDKTVTKQVLTGKRHLVTAGGITPVPGAGTLSVGLLVKASQNGKQIQPEFKVWMEGNEANADQSKKFQLKVANGDNTVTVSATPRYNVQIKKNHDCDVMGFYNLSTGDVAHASGPGLVHGRVEGYGITIQLYNTTADKGMKGIEFPEGELSFDITIKESLGPDGEVPGGEYSPMLWDYLENAYHSDSSVRGKLGREMAVGGTSTGFASYSAPYNEFLPYQPDYSQYCYDGGDITFTGSGTNYHVTVNNYHFDMENFHFPTKDSLDPNPSYGPNVGCFAAVYVEFLVQFPEEVDERGDLYFLVTADNMKAQSASGQDGGTDVHPEDDNVGLNITLEQHGEFAKENKYMYRNYENGAPKMGEWISSQYASGDSFGARGQKIFIFSRAISKSDGYTSAMNLLQKFDDEAFEVDTTETYKFICNNTGSKIGDVTVLYAAKPDKTGWNNELEMDSTHEEGLVYFDSIDNLKAAGYICVGYLYEVRNGLHLAAYYTGYMPMLVKEEAVVGHVYQTVNDLRLWDGNDPVISWKSVGSGSGPYGVGQSNWSYGTYYTGYREPSCVINNEPTYRQQYYEKSVYSNGTLSGGHVGGVGAGDSMLIIGCKTKVNIQPVDGKQTYDLDKGERYADFVIHPELSIDSDNSGLHDSEDRTDVRIKVTLPKGMKYDPSAYPDYPPATVTENPDGTTTIEWILPDRKVGDPLPDIYFRCSIGEDGGPDDVRNGDKLTVSAGISCDKDERAQTPEFGNYSETTINISQLDAISIFKSVEKGVMEAGENLNYSLHFGNNADSVANEIHLYDALPANEDGRESSFHGSYQVDSIEVDFANAPNTFAKVQNTFKMFFTSDPTARDGAKQNSIVKDKDASGVTFEEATGQTVEGTSVFWRNLAKDNVVGIYIDLGTVEVHEYINVNFSLKPVTTDSSQQGGDVYVNDFLASAAGQDTPIKSNVTTIRVVKRTISGLAWEDDNQDGIRTDNEQFKAGVTANLYRTDNPGVGGQSISVNGVTLYPAIDVTGKQVLPQTVGANGEYEFTNIREGTYYVVFTDTLGAALSPQNIGDDDTIDSDAAADGETYYISEIELPALDTMITYTFDSVHNDIGLSATSVVLPDTGGPGTRGRFLLSIILLSVAGGLIVVLYRNRKEKLI